ncbi:alkane 1-monooxygenase [Robiginitalea sp. IMCC44478]|uniref:alkane 1-monooxygenase n=1 Tax=Robiginitalea sp. IMCC44478 TaxID=3459122 RepID=UPI004043338D
MKEFKYLAAFSIPLTAWVGISLGGYYAFLTPVYAFVFIPLLEMLLPEDPANTSPAEKAADGINPVFDWLLYLNIPIIALLLGFAFNNIANSVHPIYEYIGIAFSVGIVLGTNGINVGHELGHRKSGIERLLGKILLLPSLYMHFYVEHNFGHHMHAATPEDPATARYNQSVYSFWITSVIRQYVNAWKIQIKLLQSGNKHFLSLENNMFWFSLFQTGYLLLLWAVFGIEIVGFAILCAVIGFLLLETVNYIEHYGLLRKKLPSGRYERVEEIHSWNSNHLVGRIVLYELTRHSDHHYKSSKKYQLLDYHSKSPDMPFGYPTSMVLALIPPLWFRIMNPRIPEAMKPA